MMLPPTIMRLRIKEQGKTGIRLWLPVFMLWPLGLIFLALLFPFLVLLLLIRPFVPEVARVFLAIRLIYEVLCALRGLSVEVQGEGQVVMVGFV